MQHELAFRIVCIASGLSRIRRPTTFAAHFIAAMRGYFVLTLIALSCEKSYYLGVKPEVKLAITGHMRAMYQRLHLRILGYTYHP